MPDPTADAIAALAHELDLRVTVHAADIDGTDEWGLGADDLVVTASIFKVPVLVELARQAATGRLALTDRVRVPADFMRTDGGTGLSLMLDDVEMSLRDLALLMMSVSDNRATDIVMDILGLDAINGTIARFGLIDTIVTDDCRGLFATIAGDLGEEFTDELLHTDDPVMAARIDSMRVLDAQQTTHSTPRETTALLGAVWRDEVIGPVAAAEVRRILGLQAWPHRLMSGFPDSRVRVSAKTGTMAHVRNEAGVIEHPDGTRIAVAVFVRTATPEPRNPDADRAIGTVGALAAERIRSMRGRSAR